MKISIAALWKKFCFRLPIYIIFMLTLGYTSGVLAMDKLLFPLRTDEISRPEKCGNITLKSGDAELDAIYHPPALGKPVLLYSHGNGEMLRSIKPLLDKFVQMGYGIMAYDYAGYGNSTGVPGEKQGYSDIDAAYTYLVEKKQISPGDIVIMGYSVGSGPSCYLAEKTTPKALIIVAGFASAAQVLLPFSVPLDKFPNAERLKNSSAPLLVFHGENDRVVPLRNGKKLYSSSAAKIKKIYIENAGHNDIFDRTPEFFGKIKTFLDKL